MYSAEDERQQRAEDSEHDGLPASPDRRGGGWSIGGCRGGRMTVSSGPESFLGVWVLTNWPTSGQTDGE